jgi:hypothetical protein
MFRLGSLGKLFRQNLPVQNHRKEATMSVQPTLRSLTLFTLIVVTAFAATGCTSFHPRQLDVLHVFGPRRPKPPAPGEPAFTMVIDPALGKTDAYPVPLENPISVQQALVETGTLYYFRRQKLFVERQVPEAGRSLRMPVKFDYGAGAVTPDTDYALLPGDRLIVSEDTTTIFDQAMEEIGGPLKVMQR